MAVMFPLDQADKEIDGWLIYCVTAEKIINFIISLHKYLFYGIILKMKSSPRKGLPGLSSDNIVASHLVDHPKRLP